MIKQLNKVKASGFPFGPQTAVIAVTRTAVLMEQCPQWIQVTRVKRVTKRGEASDTRSETTDKPKEDTEDVLATVPPPKTSEKTLCGLSLLILVVFLPTWIINCVYHLEDLGPFRPVCFEDNYSMNESKLPMAHTIAHTTMNKLHHM